MKQRPKNKGIHNKEIGAIGENCAGMFLVKHGYSIILKNYLRKCGEIDLIVSKGGKLLFVEVKTVSRESSSVRSKESYRPEENIHYYKLKRFHRTIGLYLLENRLGEIEYDIAYIVVVLHMKQRLARVTLIRDTF